jgi:hypothetical protein
LAAIWIGVAGWAYSSRRGLPSDYLPGKYTRRLRRFCLLSGAATGSLVVCILADVMLATIRLGPLNPSLSFLVPIGSIVFELACASALIGFICALARRAGSIVHLQQI